MTIELKGHLDTSKVPEVNAYIETQLAGVQPEEHVVVDCSELEFISSSGLRLVLTIKKKHPDMEVIGVNAEVYNVFEMTGFTRIITVSKALRKIDLSACQLIGEGGNGAVYRINDEEIVKVSKHRNGGEELVFENQRVREAFLMGIPTAISFDTVDCGNGRKGIVMEALDSTSLGKYVMQNPAVMDDIIPKYVALFRQVNAIRVESPLFHPIKDKLRSWLALPERDVNDEEAALLASLLDEVPDTNHFIHFDGHTGNVLMQGSQDNRSLMLIDFGDAGTGHPVLEVAGWAFILLEPDYAQGLIASDMITGMPYMPSHEFGRRVLSEMFGVTDAAELDILLYQASLIGRLKLAFIAQHLAKKAPDANLRAFMHRVSRETLELVPEIKVAIREFVRRLDAMSR